MNEVFDLKHLSSSQMKIGQWVLHNEPTVMISTEKEIAQIVGVSIATVSRFWQAIGFQNLKAYKHYLIEQREITPAKKIARTLIDIEYTDVHIHHLNRSIHHLQTTLNRFQLEPFEQAVTKIRQASCLYVYAPGPSLGLGELVTYRLRRFGISVQLIRFMGSEILEELSQIDESCVILLFSFGRLLREGEILLKHANDIRCKTIVISDRMTLDIPIAYDILLYAERGEKKEFHSMIAPIFLIESLIIELSKGEQALTNLEKLSTIRKTYKAELPR